MCLKIKKDEKTRLKRRVKNKQLVNKNSEKYKKLIRIYKNRRTNARIVQNKLIFFKKIKVRHI